MKKEKIFISAYACEPNLGSEIGVGWNWVIQMSKYFDVWVLTRRSNKNNIENWLADNPLDRKINFIYYDIPKIFRLWKKGLRGVRTYYNIWQIFTNRIVKQTMQENDIHIYHLLTYGNSLWKASKYGMKQFFVWGPTGGVDLIPKEFVRYYGIKFKIRELIRTTVIKNLHKNRGFNKRCESADIILCKSESMYNAVPKECKSKARIFTDCAVDELLIEEPDIKTGGNIEYLTVGNLDAWRNFDVLIEAFAKAYENNKKIRLKIVGSGKDCDRLKSLINIRNMSEVIELTGRVTIEEYKKLMKESDVVINPSYKEGAVTMAFDAMAMSKPFICFETGGYTKNLNSKCAIILNPGSREELIEDMEKAIEDLFDEERRKEYSKKMSEIALKSTWTKKGQEISEIIYSKYNEQ